MAKVYIPIIRQDYALSGESPSQQFAGIEPNVFSPSISPVNLTASLSDANWIADPSYSTYGVDDFKDHKTLFIFENSGAAASITIEAGDTYAAREAKNLSIGSGETRALWIDSSKFADKKTGAIKITATSASIKAYGVEMR